MMKSKFLALLFALILAFGVLSGFTASASAQAIDDNDEILSITDVQENTVEVFSYKDIFRAYYDMVLEKAEATGKRDICSFEEFCNNYYSSGMDLQSYINYVISDNEYGQPTVIEDPPNTINSSASYDADYMLSKYDYSSTPKSDFDRPLCYGIFFNYSSLMVGDIVYDSRTVFNNIGHTAILYNTSKSGYYGSYYQTIEAVGGGVQFGFLDDKRMIDFGVIILRVNATTYERSKITYFRYKQLGKDFSFNMTRANTSIDSSKWYCSELVNAAYLYAGINLGAINSDGGCLPINIFSSFKTYVQITFINYVLDIGIVGKSGNKWTIKVYNNTSSNQNVYYNTKMCFVGDAKAWSGLKNVTYLPVNSGVLRSDFVISENFLAGSVAFSYHYGNKRVITYANWLDAATKTLDYKHMLIDWK